MTNEKTSQCQRVENQKAFVNGVTRGGGGGAETERKGPTSGFGGEKYTATGDTIMTLFPPESA